MHGEARVIVMEPGQSYSAHADIDDRWHLTLDADESYLVDLQNEKMWKLIADGNLYLMDSGRLHTASNYGYKPRFQLVIRKRLKGRHLENPVFFNLTLIDPPYNVRYLFDKSFSILLNKLEKAEKITNFRKVSDKEIFATSRSLNSLQINQKNIRIIDPSKTPNILEKYKNEITHLVISVPPDQSGDIFLKNINFNLHELINLKWIGYLSATSVYGDHDGQFVSETSRLLTKSKRGISRQLAEDQWSQLSKKYNLPLHIFRIAGIYGPERNILGRIQSRNFTRIIKKGHFFSRIYINDLTNIILASMNKPNPISIYNIADDCPSTLDDVIDYISKKISITIPNEVLYETLSKKEQIESFFSENKKVSNRLIKEELGIILEYPSYKEGYNQIINLNN